MRRRELLALLVLTLVIVAGGVVALVVDARRVRGGPEQTALAYLDAWAADNLPQMRERVASAPADFFDRHRRMRTDLQILSVKLTPGRLVRRDDRTADLPFTGVWQVAELGRWPFSSVLHLGVRDGAWKVIWTPETLHPGVGAGERLRVSEIPVPGTELFTRQGRPLPRDSGAAPYFEDLVREIDDLDEDPPSGWAIEAVAATGRVRRLVVYRQAAERRFRTTLDWWTEAAADRALDGVGGPAAIVAVRPSTGEVLAVADRLAGQGAFYRRYPAGAAFTTVTAAALLRGPVAPGTQVDCPASYTVPGGRTVVNGGSAAHGTVTLAQAYALSCDTTFSRLAVERLGDGRLRREAEAFGFGARLKSGLGGLCGAMREPETGDQLGLRAIGDDAVAATPLCMATLAAAVKDGTWRPPRLMSKTAVARLDGPGGPRAKPVPVEVASELRAMMAAAAADETVAAAGLPGGVSGKAATARPASGREHAWFIGYRGDLAFAVFVEHAGTGAGTAAAAAARFLRAL
ncbi:penicillin-binding transpeptidase domain-containing protein [Sphaerisporangium sp. TRM90804]|uniref:penicillin-binding transpeptidase domain-containing protein n=1 Tax=Sphaerisporangium sp. TRM90804 TaxID=3031113 RepID=UPI00244817CD|nr:penicillin-binding transpeptidase domain-containing protein [Sphaerisporangium sp. TRM90804]MDH2429054.1 penicillin-binding transpeptidase domain-containing protein [Sphaerisporangium sp. TRM90804]